MKEFFKRLYLPGFLLFAIIGGVVLSSLLHRTPATEVLPFNAKAIAWKNSVKDSFDEAKKANKILYLDFYADWCTYCKEMDKITYRDSRVIGLSNDFVMTKVNVDQHQLLAQYFHVEGLPTIVFANAAKGELTRFDGYIPPSALADLMSKVLGSIREK